MTLPTIVTIIRRSEQGATKPLVCQADDGNIYFAKGRSAGLPSIIHEWLAANLAQAFGLPIAPFTLLKVPAELISPTPTLSETALFDPGDEIVFGSVSVQGSELMYSRAQKIPAQLAADIAVFDWWIKNADRTLTEKGGNPNLLWDAGGSKLWVIDHNLAFEAGFHAQAFLENHDFQQNLQNVAADFFLRDVYRKRLSAALAAWPQATASIPTLWHYRDAEQTMPLDFPFEALWLSLASCEDDSFWHLDSRN